MENKKWEQIENEIRQFIDAHDFENAFRLLKKSAVEKGNTQLVQEIADLKKQFVAFKKTKKNNEIPAAEAQTAEYELAYKLRYFIECLQKGGATAVPIPFGSPSGAEALPNGEEDRYQMSAAEIQPSASIAQPSKISAPPAIFKKEAPLSAMKSAKQKSVKPPTEGGILYNIPEKMQLGIQTRCIVRLAFDKTQLKKDTDNFSNEVIKTVQVSEVMEVDLIDTSGEDAFKIQFISQKEQFIDKNSATEWVINVKALKSGSYNLTLKVAIIEKIDGKDRRKEMILDEVVAVISDNVVATDTFKSPTNPTFQLVGVQTILPEGVPTPSVKTVLFMGANPPGTEFLQLEIEHSRISFQLEGKFRFPASKFLSPSEIPKLFMTHRPNVIHFSGHGKAPSVSGTVSGGENGNRGLLFPKDYDKTGGIIIFADNMREMKVIDDKMLDIIFASAVQKLHIPIELVVFNSCHSESQAKVVGKSVPYVIGTSNAIKDSIAISFAVGFYANLVSGESIENAFALGKMQAVMEDIEAENLIVLYKNGTKMTL